MCKKICLRKIAKEICNYNVKTILESGENDMFDLKIDEEAVKKMFEEDVCKDCESNDNVAEQNSYSIENDLKKDNLKKEPNQDKIDLSKSINDIQNSEVFKTIINLKNKA